MEDWKAELEKLEKEMAEYKEEQELVVKVGEVARELNKEKAQEFLREKAEPAFKELTAELKKYVKLAIWTGGDILRELQVKYHNGAELLYQVTVNISGRYATPQSKYVIKDRAGRRLLESGGNLLKKQKKADVSDFTKNDIIADFMAIYKRHRWELLES